MKLHLPKLLLTAVLAACSLVQTAFGYRVEVTQGGDTWANSYSFSFVLTEGVLGATNASDVLFVYGGKNYNDDLGSNAIVLNYDEKRGITLQVGRGDLNNNTEGKTIGEYTYTFANENATVATTLTAGQRYTVSVAGADQSMTLTLSGGDLTESVTYTSYNGNMKGNVGDGNAFSSEFNNAYSSDYVWAGTGESGALDYTSTSWTNVNVSDSPINLVKGADIVLNAGDNLAKDLTIGSTVFVDTVKVNDNYTITGTSANAKLDASSITIAADKALTLSGTMTVAGVVNGNINVRGGEVTINNSVNGLITIADGMVATSSLRNGASVMVVGGGTLKLTGHDGVGYDGNALSSLTLKGSEGKVATLDVDDTGSCTFTTTISMQGYSQVIGTAINTWRDSGTNILVSNKENTISLSTFEVRKNATINVDQDGELLISSTVANGSDNAGLLTKTGAGKLVLSGTNTYTGGTSVNAGTLATKSATALGTGAVTVAAGANLELGSELTVSDLTIAEGGSLIFGNGTKLTVTGTLTLTSANDIKLAEGITFDSADEVTLATGTLALGKGFDATTWAGAGTYTINGVEYTSALKAEGDAISVTFKQMVEAPGEPISVTGWALEGTALTLNVNAALSEGMEVSVDLLDDATMKDILGKLDKENYTDGKPMVTITLQGTSGTITANELNEVVFVKGDTGLNYWGEMVGGQLMYNVERIPEPTTATLSLLALMGLAARRRRK